MVNIHIREIVGQEELLSVEKFQQDIWEIPDLDVVPLTQLVAVKQAGGVLIGAFDGNTLVGFVYGFVGFEHGVTTHHSHMLAVKANYREHHLGYKLKLAQREFVLAQGIEEMTWTFDPLQSLNAYFNFSRLGVVSNCYLIDFYGAQAASSLHQNGTDRLWVTWPLKKSRVIERLSGKAATIDLNNVGPLVEMNENTAPKLYELSSVAEAFIEIPARIVEIERKSLALAAEWREATRKAFTEALAAGFIVTGFVRGDQSGKYVLSRQKIVDFKTQF